MKVLLPVQKHTHMFTMNSFILLLFSWKRGEMELEILKEGHFVMVPGMTAGSVWGLGHALAEEG